MAENVKIEVDLIAGKLSLECPDSSVESILARITDFLPRFREQAQPLSRPVAHHAPRPGVEEPESRHPAKATNDSPDATVRKRGSGSVRAAATPESRLVVQNLQLNVDEAGLLPWDSLAKDWKKYLWILEAARKKDIDGLTNAEISYLMDKTFRESRSPKVVNNLKKKIKSRFVQPASVNVDGKAYSIWRILADGSKEVAQAADPARA